MDSIHFAMCLDYRISPEIFQQIESLVSKYSHENFNFYVKPDPLGILLIAEESVKRKNRILSQRCFNRRFIRFSNHRELKKHIDCTVKSLIEHINQYKLLKI